MRVSTARWVAGCIAAASIVLMAGALVLEYVDRELLPASMMSWTFDNVSGQVVNLAVPVVGFVLASRRPANRIGWLFLTAGIVLALEAFGAQYGLRALVAAPGSLPAGRAFAWFANSLGGFPIVILACVFLLFPTGHLRSRRWRPAAWFMAAVFALVAVVLLITTTRYWSHPFNSFSGGLPAYLAATFFVTVAALVVGVTALVVRFARSSGEERLQLKWFAAAALLVVVTVIASFLANEAVANVLSSLAFLCLYAAIAIAVLKYRLYDIDIVISKAVLYGSLAVFITAVYAALVVGVGTLVGNQRSPLLTALAAAVVAVAFQPARQWAGRLANRVVYGRRATPYQVLSDFAQRIGGTYAAEDVLPQMAQIVAAGTGAKKVMIWLRVGDELHPEASSDGNPREGPLSVDGQALPPLPDGEISVPVVHQGELLGAISITMPKDEPLRPAGQQLVTDVASQAGLALANAGLIEDLRASRQRLVTAQDEARRRLERNIHDGAQQDLVAWPSSSSWARPPSPRTRHKPGRSSASSKQTPRARWRTCATSPAGSTRRCWPTSAWPRHSTPRPANRRCRSRWKPTGSGDSAKTPRRRCISVAWKHCRTPRNTPTPRTPGSPCKRATGPCSSPCPTTGPATTQAAPRWVRACGTWPTGSPHSAASSRSGPLPAAAPSSPGIFPSRSPAAALARSTPTPPRPRRPECGQRVWQAH